MVRATILVHRNWTKLSELNNTAWVVLNLTECLYPSKAESKNPSVSSQDAASWAMLAGSWVFSELLQQQQRSTRDQSRVWPFQPPVRWLEELVLVRSDVKDWIVWSEEPQLCSGISPPATGVLCHVCLRPPHYWKWISQPTDIQRFFW